MEIIRKNLGIYGANTYIVFDSSKKAVIIDCGGDADVVLKVLEENGLKAEAILLTHGHFDHIGGVNKLREFTKAPIYGCEYERDLFDDAEHNLSVTTLLGAVTVSCDKYFTEDDELKFTDFTFKVYRSPGHTEGGVLFYCDGHLFTGDTLFSRSIGRSDLYSGDEKKIYKSLKMIVDTFAPDTLIYPGHGPISNLKFELEKNPYLQNLDGIE